MDDDFAGLNKSGVMSAADAARSSLSPLLSVLESLNSTLPTDYDDEGGGGGSDAANATAAANGGSGNGTWSQHNQYSDHYYPSEFAYDLQDGGGSAAAAAAAAGGIRSTSNPDLVDIDDLDAQVCK